MVYACWWVLYLFSSIFLFNFVCHSKPQLFLSNCQFPCWKREYLVIFLTYKYATTLFRQVVLTFFCIISGSYWSWTGERWRWHCGKDIYWLCECHVSIPSLHLVDNMSCQHDVLCSVRPIMCSWHTLDQDSLNESFWVTWTCLTYSALLSYL